MAETTDLGALVRVEGEAIGQPGQRRFRLCLLANDGRAAACWMEKEQLAALGEAIETALRDQDFTYAAKELDDAGIAPPFPLNPMFDFRVGRLALGLNPGERNIFVTAGDTAEDEESSVEVRGAFDYHQAHELAAQIRTVVAAGRPPCPLCSAPMDPAGHFCVKKNGHPPAQ